jgi:hypothetical protein
MPPARRERGDMSKLVFGSMPIEADRHSRKRSARTASASWNWTALLGRHLALLALAIGLGVTISGSGGALSALPGGISVATRTTYGSTLTVPRPAVTAAGDVLVASVDARLSGASTIAAPSGWVLIRRDSSAPGYRSLTQALYYKVAGSSEPASYSWSLGAPSPTAGAILDLKGIDTRTPVDSHSGAFTSGGSSIVAPSVRTAAAGDLLVGFYGVASNKSIRPPSGMSEALTPRARRTSRPPPAPPATWQRRRGGALRARSGSSSR